MQRRPRLTKTKMKSRVLIAVMGVGALTALATCCGGGSHSQQGPTAGPTAILNGSTLATVNSHWVAQNCGVKVELAANGEFRSAVTDTSGTTHSSSGTWTASGTNSADTGGSFGWVNRLTNISGSTSSQTFSAGVDVYLNYQQSLGTFTITLQPGGLP